MHSLAPARLVLERTATTTTELQIFVDASVAVLTKRTLRREDPLDLPATVQLSIPVAAVPALVAALEAARAAGGERG